MYDNADDQLKEPPVGIIDFPTIIKDNYYYVDKTPFFKQVLKGASQVLLITRPRRFGKTLAMNTLSHFLRINPDNPGDTTYQDALFSQTQIYENKAFCQRHMGKYPVLFMTLKEVYGKCYQEAYSLLAGDISALAQEHRYLLDSTKLTNDDKKFFSVLLKVDLMLLPQNRMYLCKSLQFLSQMLFKHFEQKVIVLIDEYDVPLAKAYSKGYYNDMVELISSLFSSVLKDPKILQKGVLTGCLRVSKESIFTGLNNMIVNSVANDNGKFAEFIGFTSQEVAAMLDYYGLSEQKNAVKEWYDGYRIGRSELYCPWDVISFCNDAISDLSLGNKISAPSSYWTATSGNDVIQQFMPYLKEADAERMQALLDGGEIEFVLNEQLNYNEIEDLHLSDDFWTLLLFTGYLTCLNVTNGSKEGIVCRVRIPNREIRKAFEQYISAYYKKDSAIVASSNEIAEAFFAGDAGKINFLLTPRLENFVSVRDLAVKAAPENYYHGFLNGVFSSISSQSFSYMSNGEAGDGYADIIFRSNDKAVGVVIELKAVKDKKLMPERAAEALRQIHSKKYDAAFEQSVKKIYSYGIAFCRKACFVQCEAKEL